MTEIETVRNELNGEIQGSKEWLESQLRKLASFEAENIRLRDGIKQALRCGISTGTYKRLKEMLEGGK